MNKKRPLNINPLTIDLPLSAKVSITHRVAGVLVFLLIPFLLFALQRSLGSEEGLLAVKGYSKTPLGLTILWTFLAAFLFHFFAGIRHLLMDIHLGDSLQTARKSALVVIVGSIIVWLALFFLWGKGV